MQFECMCCGRIMTVPMTDDQFECYRLSHSMTNVFPELNEMTREEHDICDECYDNVVDA